MGADRHAAGTRRGGAADIVPEPRQHDARLRIGAAERDRDSPCRRRRAVAYCPPAAGAGPHVVAGRRHARTADGDVGGGAAGVVDVDGAADLARAGLASRHDRAGCDARFLHAGDAGLWTVAGAAAVTAGPVVVAEGSSRRGQRQDRGPHHRARRSRDRAAGVVARTAGAQWPVRSWRGRRRISGSRVPSRSARDRADRAEAWRLRRDPGTRGASRPPRTAARDARRRISGRGIGVAVRRLFVRRGRAAGGTAAEERGSRSRRHNRARAHLHGDVGLLQDARPVDGAGPRVHGGRRSRGRRDDAGDHRSRPRRSPLRQRKPARPVDPVRSGLRNGGLQADADRRGCARRQAQPVREHTRAAHLPACRRQRHQPHVCVRAGGLIAGRGRHRRFSAGAAARQRCEPAGDFREELPLAARRQRPGLDPARRGQDVPHTGSRGRVRGGDRSLRRAQLSRDAPHS